MGYKHKQILVNKLIVVVVFLAILLCYLFFQWRTSIILNEKDRINIAVFSEIPFVYSINLRKDFAVVTYFHPDYLVKVPHGYDWYRLGSLNLLGKIEKQREKILRSAFSELIGAPIDLVFYPKRAKIISDPELTFSEFYYEFIKKELFSSQYQRVIPSLFDQLLIKNLFQIRQDHLLFLDTADLGFKQKNRTYYYSDKLDTRLKGLFYHDSLISYAFKAVIVTDKNRYQQAQQLLRQLEGIGIKVIDIEVKKRVENKHCLLAISPDQTIVGRKLQRIFNCKIKTQNSQIIRYTLSQ